MIEQIVIVVIVVAGSWFLGFVQGSQAARDNLKADAARKELNL